MTIASRSVLITGASSGIGQVAALTLRKRGYRVFATARKTEDVEALQAQGVVALPLDYADPASVAACADAVLEATGGTLFALFNNGAYGQLGAVEDLPTAALRAQFEANLFGWHDLTRRFIPGMRRAGAGRIVQCSSVLGIVAMKYRGAYVASKFALEGLTDTLRLELAGTGIHVVSIRPGPIATKFVPNAMAVFERTIDAAGSVHAETYEKRRARMQRGGATRFKLPPSAVVDALIKALEAERPRVSYAVTVPTHLMGIARRFLTERALSKFLRDTSDRET